MTQSVINKNEIDSLKNTEQQEYRWIDLVIFFVISFGWSWILLLPKVLASYELLTLPEWLSQTLGGFATFGPFIGAIIIVGIRRRGKGIRKLLKRGIEINFNKKWLIPTFLLIPVMAGISFGITLLIFENALESDYYNWGLVVGVAVIGFFVGGPLGEEFGWRGFALDPLQKRLGATGASLVLGAIWSLWHLPLHFIKETTQYYIPIWAFFLMNTTLAIFYTWLYNNTNRSILVAIIFHWIANVAGALLPYWQLGLINDQMSDGLLLPTYGMLIGFGITLLTAIIIIITFSWKKLTLIKELGEDN
ncbi:MAG: CPBP family intramembrane metalloprotease [Asgard group archaeon]|nr:CPBP family intramembrane metalloprotease [Asgard group archaeon]